MMTNTLKLLLRNQLKSSKVIQQASGFTLIELLIGMAMAFLIITPLLGFMISVMNTEQQEQAKANSEQEIQAGLDYIARDLKQAVYIYDADGINALTSTANSGPQIPAPTDRTPVLVFWKRELVEDVIANSGTADKDDTFVYSLVAYYLIKNNDTTWSKAARIGRWQIRDGVVTTSTSDSDSKLCTGYTSRYVKGPTSNPDKYCPSTGFEPFDLSQQGTITESMNAWTKKASTTYTADTLVLVDYIDQTTTGAPLATCPNSASADITWSKVAPTSRTSFYACIDVLNTTSEVFIRGNALARINTQGNNIAYSDGQKTYFPTANTRVQGRGYLYK
ncbi:hormogonium polysaccharide secretion pseudopilin HpsC [Anabaena cylindrica UHCC 0172]|uniref:hormogonium polysaccharide secretion pseudopilin HpsC n=1 Tax=Anabaena cylindrica TaxID=1165 RepID=UPI002B202605|nr:hormogonium polysaccharide secretion pseudopilin HpsC [Anabaena cylindrica]MEA5551288.1 hormogonium polysaccharide secretion pseudopilin HpsC [Anabaena cylindrica UHCC 0172]